MIEGVDYDLVEYGDTNWSILYQDIEFIIDSISYVKDDAKIKYTIIHGVPDDVVEFDKDVIAIVLDITSHAKLEVVEKKD